MGVEAGEDNEFHSGNVIRILISTDNHLGYAEKHGVRGDDSFRAFEEVLQLAKEKEVDFLLLGGDLFHDNKPSRNTLHRCMSLLRRYCLGDSPVAIQFCSDPVKNFGNGGSVANYMDPFLSVSLPLFTIHGNHDDPTGSVGPEQLSSVDLLHSAGLLNYFGKSTDSKSVCLEPILLRKGVSSIALYGLGNIRDERLYTTWNDEKGVHWKRPEAQEGTGTESWFNIFVLHQNRVQRGSTRSVTEAMLPKWLDFVVWGHEHECRIDMEYGVDGPVITQPGSTVATSLIDGEAKEKHVGLLEVFQDQFKWSKIRLKNVRKFIIEDIVLSEVKSLHPAKPKQVEAYLREKVEAIVRKADEEFDEKEEEVDVKLRQPLIRLRVEYSGGFDVIASHRFGQGFVGEVANSSDILLFHKKRTQNTQKRSTFAKGVLSENPSGRGVAGSGSNDADDVRVPDLVKHYLGQQDRLDILPVTGLNSAIDRYVTKAEPHAIVDYVEKQLQNTQTVVREERGKVETLEESDIQTICDRLMKATEVAETVKERSTADVTMTEGDTGARIEENAKDQQTTRTRMNKRPAMDSDEDSNDNSSEEALKPIPAKSHATRSRSASKRATASTKAATKSKAGTSRGRGAPKKAQNKSARTRQTTLSFSAADTRREGSDSDLDEDEIVDSDEEEHPARGSNSRKRAAGFTSTRSAKQRRNKAASLHSIYDIDAEDE